MEAVTCAVCAREVPVAALADLSFVAALQQVEDDDALCAECYPQFVRRLRTLFAYDIADLERKKRLVEHELSQCAGA
jgi:hypothetical protein